MVSLSYFFTAYRFSSPLDKHIYIRLCMFVKIYWKFKQVAILWVTEKQFIRGLMHLLKSDSIFGCILIYSFHFTDIKWSM